MKHSELRHQPRHVNPRIQVVYDFYNKSGFRTQCPETAFVFLIRPTNYIFKKLKHLF